MTLNVIAECLGCGCSDDEPCQGGCNWTRVNYDLGVGVCSTCPDEVAFFDDVYNQAVFEEEQAEVKAALESEPESLLLPGDMEYQQTLSYLRDRRPPR